MTEKKVRDLSLFSYLEFSFHSINIDNQNFQMSLYCAGSSYKDGIIEEDLFYEPDGYQYFTANFEPDGFDCMRDKFLGMYHTEDNPVAVINGKCSGSFERAATTVAPYRRISFYSRARKNVSFSCWVKEIAKPEKVMREIQ